MPDLVDFGRYSGDLLGPKRTVLFLLGIFSSVLNQSEVIIDTRKEVTDRIVENGAKNHKNFSERPIFRRLLRIF